MWLELEQPRMKNVSRVKYLVVYVSAPEEEARSLAAALVERRLAACVNLLPGLRSIYVWKGEVCDDPEQLLVIKTTVDRFEELKETVVALHPYEVPEVIATPIVDGHDAYLEWLDEVTRNR